MRTSIAGRSSRCRLQRRQGSFLAESYHTERAVFRLTDRGLLLTEIAPGVDLRRDILDQMEFEPLIAEDLHTMDPRIFRSGRMEIADALNGLQAGW